jgi:SH3-like domain-containing protein
MRLAAPIAAILLTATVAADAAEDKQPPYWASISAGRARMRTGPARTYPAVWLYQRADLPVRVVAVFKEWRKVEDPDGAQGWMQANLLSATRTAIVKGPQPVPMLEEPGSGTKLRWRAAPGVVGRLSQCGAGWCRFDVKGRAGFVNVAALWGVDPSEEIE